MVTKDKYIELAVHGVVYIDKTTLSVNFLYPDNFTYEPGDWVDINFRDGNPTGGITYSLSSSPTEDVLTITFRTGISPFKRRLQALQPGDVLYISQYGNDYDFHLKEHRSSVLIAGGIGVAPFRSMLKEMSDTKNKNQVQLIYLNKGKSFIFADEINQWRKALPNIDVHFLDTTEMNRKKRGKILLSLINKNAQHYFIAGPEGMVEATEHLLIDSMKVSPKNIRIDSFGGY